MDAQVDYDAGRVRNHKARGDQHRSWHRGFALCVLWALAMVLAAPAAATSYVYDVNGRVIAVTNDAGESARYVYDVMGNISRVDRLASDELALFAFTPGRGVSGMQVRLQGHGFNTQPTANLVRFAGTSATVVSGNASELMVVVPAGAVTGPISVTTGSKTVSSSTDFVVDQNAQQPRIDTIAPQVVNAGATVTVTGGSLYPIAHQTTTRIGTRAGVIGAVDNEQLTFAVPLLAASGKVSVSTPYGMAVSTQDLVVLPSGVAAADIAGVRRVIPDAPAGSDTVQTPGQQFAVLVDAIVGELLDVQLSSITGGNLGWSLYDPTNRRVLTGTATTASPTILLPAAARAGTYLLLIKPAQTPASWNLAIERSRKITVGAEALAVATTVPGQRKRFYFQAGPEQHLGIGLAELALSTGSSISTAVHRGDVSLTTASCTGSRVGCQLNVRATQRGNHTLTLTPGSAQTFQTSITLSDDLAANLVREVPLELSVPRRGQNARLFFTAQAGESLALQVLVQQTLPAGYNVNYAIYRPDGTLIKSANTATHNIYTLPTLPQSGTYSVFVDGEYGASVAAQIVLRVGADSGGQLDGEPAEHATETGGASVYFDFEVDRLDELVGIGISDLVLSSGTTVSMTLYRPDGSTSSNTTCYAARGGCGLNLRSAQVGRHTVLLQPSSASQTMRLKATVTRDLQVEVEPEQPVQFDLDRRGQNARLFFETTEAQTLAFLVSGVSTLPAGKSVTFAVYTMDNVLVTSTSVSAPEVLRLTQLAPGRYYLFIDPADGAQAQARVTLSAGWVAGLAVDGDPVEYVAPTSGHPAFMAFSTTEPEQRLGVGLHGIELSAGTSVSATVYGPAGQALGSSSCAASRGCEINVRAAVPGNYSLVVRPQAAQDMRFTATVSNDSVIALARETPLELEIPRFGQNARLMFDAEAGDNLALQVSGQMTSGGASASYAIYKPDGTSLSSITVTGFNQQRMMRLPASGQYMILVDPAYGGTLRSRVVLTAGNGGDPVLDGKEGVVLSPAAGQATFATFEVTEVDQRIGVGLSELVLNSGTYATVTLYRPNGTSVGNINCLQSNKGCELNLRAPETGVYGIVVDPQNGAQVLSYRVSVSNDLRRTLPRDTDVALGIARHGQNAWLAFDAEAGETLGLRIAGQVTLPAGNNVVYQVLRPDGALLASRTPITHDALNLPTLPMTGIYQVFVDPRYGATASVQLRLTDGSDGGTRIEGDPVAFETSQPGQPTYLTFQATAGEQLGLGISDLVLSTGSNVAVNLYRPGGASGGAVTCSASYQGCTLGFTAAESGTYSVVVMPQSGSQTASFKVTLSRDLVRDLPRDAALDPAIQRRGQKARLNFTGQVGEVLALQVAGQSTFPAGRTVFYRVYKPDGTLLVNVSTAAFTTQELRLPAEGTYQVLVEPSYGETLSSRVTLTAGKALAVDGAAASIATDQGGQPVRATFNAVAGDRLGVGVHDLAVSTGAFVAVGVFRPDGTSAASTTCSVANNGCKLSVTANQTGTYVVVTTPQSATQTVSYRLAVSQDLTGVLGLDQPVELVVPRRGQNARLSFDGQAGQWLSLQVAGQVTEPAARTVYYRVYRPDGTLMTSLSNTNAGALRLAALPVAGTYTVLVDSGQGETLQARLTLASGSSAMVLDGASAAIATDLGGQEVFLTFAATDGQRLGVGLRDLQVSSGTNFSAMLYRPDGNSASATCTVQYGGCELDITANATGVYRLYVKPQSATQQIQFTAIASTDVEATLAPNTLLTLALDRPGQNGWLSFSGVSGGRPTLEITDHTTQPAGGTVNYVIYKPDGTSLTSTNVTGARVFQLPALPTSGAYRIRVNPTYASPYAVGLTLK